MPSRPRSSEPGPSLEGCGGAIVGITLAYIGAEAALSGPLHPVHWGITLLGGVIGYLVGETRHRYKTSDAPFHRPRDRR